MTIVEAHASASELAARNSIVAAAREMSRLGLSPGRSGNVSCRVPGGMLITPTGLGYEHMEATDITFVGQDGSCRSGERAPSSEWHFHLAAYAARPDRAALVHTHSMHATVLACAHKPIPAFHYMVAIAGGKNIPCVPYATFGTEALARHVASGLAQRDVCLMANHGLVALGSSPAGALEIAREVEILAEQYCKLLAIGAPHIIDDAEMAIVIEKFKTYGQRPQA